MSGNKVGVHDFLEMTSEFHPQWSVFAVEAPIEVVEEALSKFQHARPKETAVPFYLQTKAGDLHDKLQGRDFAYVVPVIQIANSSWVVVYWEVFFGGISACDWAESVSARLSTRCAALYHADTAAVLCYDLFDKGEKLESAQCCPQDGEGISSWKSKLRSKPELDFLEDVDEDFEGDDEAYEAEEERISLHNDSLWKNYINEIFSDWGIYLPAFYPINQLDGVRIEVEVSSENTIERIDLMYPRQNW